jgi:hypothetical protein
MFLPFAWHRQCNLAKNCNESGGAGRLFPTSIILFLRESSGEQEPDAHTTLLGVGARPNVAFRLLNRLFQFWHGHSLAPRAQ